MRPDARGDRDLPLGAAAGRRRCAGAAPARPRSGRRLSLEALKLLKAYQRLDIEAIAALRLPEAVEREVEGAMRDFMRVALERDPRSLAFLDEVRSRRRRWPPRPRPPDPDPTVTRPAHGGSAWSSTPARDADAHALERLGRDMIGWLTTVTPDGQPQTFPIWFLWVDGEVLVYSDRRAKRNANLGANPRVALHLDDDGRGNDIVIVEGEARIDESTPPVHRERRLPRQVRRVDPRDAELGRGDARPIYNVPLWIRPTRGRAFGA